MSSLRTPSWCVGTPAACCQSYESELDLLPLVGALQATQSHLVWLDSARQNAVTGRYSVVGWDPWLTLSATGSTMTTASRVGAGSVTRGNPFEHLQRLLNDYPGCHGEGLPPVGVGWLALLGYGLNRWIERLPAEKPSPVRLPDLCMYGMCMLVVVDHLESRSWCVSLADPHEAPERARRQARERLEAFEDLRCRAEAVPAPVQRTLAIEPTMTQAAFETRVHRIKRHIAAGDIFQANLSQQFLGAGCGSPWTLYRALRAINPSPFACFAKSPDGSIVSCSPERLIHTRSGWAGTRPIAGTRPRGMTSQEDLENSLELMLSEKERAEHIMLVDLERNDLGRICRAGSVVVDELMTVEAYSHVMHIVSNVRGRLSTGTDTAAVIRALFPGGTITGCPKVRCMEILREIEPVGRGMYTGSAGWLGFNGEMDLNLLIRTIVTDASGRVSFHAGAGIVADSQPDREYHETLAKARALMEAFEDLREPATEPAPSMLARKCRARLSARPRSQAGDAATA